MQTIHVDQDSRGVARVTLARPTVHNAFDETMIGELKDTFLRVAADPSIRCVVLAAEGKLFCAGADIGWMQRQSQNSHDANLDDARRFAEMMRALYECPKPSIARVHGNAFGGGIGLMAACDIVIAARDARFAVSEAKFGILPAVIAPYLVQAVGARQAMRWALEAALFSADEARAMGLLHESVGPEALDAAVERCITALLGNSPAALVEIKALFRHLGGPIDAELRESTARTISRVRSGDDAREGFAAFMEKRAARWVLP